MNSEQVFLRINERENAIDSLANALKFLEESRSKILKLKWFIIAIHHAIYNFMLLALLNTDQSGIWSNKKVYRIESGMIDIFNFKNRLISFREALSRIQDKDRMGGYMNSKPFKAKSYHIQSMEILNDRLRNMFIHYRPSGWSLHDRYIYEAVKPGLEIISFIINESGRCRLLDEGDREYINNLIDKIQDVINERLK